METQAYLPFDEDTVGRTIDRSRAIATRDGAAEEALQPHKRNKRLMDVLRALASVGMNGGLTRTEVADMLHCCKTGVCQAFTDSLEQRLVETTGERRMGDGGRKIDCYRLTGRGFRFLMENK